MPELPNLPVPPQWSIVLGQFGKVCIIVATLLFVLAAVLSLLRSNKWPKVTSSLFPIAVGALFSAAISLGILFFNDRFEWEYVRTHSDKATEAAYKIAAIWSGQEGSFLLWAFMSALFGLFALPKMAHLRRTATAIVSLFLAAITAILIYESPFELVRLHNQVVAPIDGLGLAPSLNNYWVVIHPPTIFAGFGSLTILFALAVSAMLHKDSKEWIRMARPWALISTSLLGLGLCMGGFWAYETLNWGGFWAWDPVENTSFVPWCFMVMFVHGILVQNTRGKWIAGNYLLAAAPFLTFLYGTFLTRSGFLGDTSVHSFAEMDRKALWILIGIGLSMILGFFTIWVLRAFKIAKEATNHEAEPRFGRVSMYMLGNSMLLGLALAMGIGMSVPVIMSMFGQKPKVVEEGLYHFVVPYFFVPLMILMAIAPFIGWRQTDRGKFWWKVYAVGCFTICFSGIAMLIMGRTDWAGPNLMTGQIEFPFGMNVNRPFWVMTLITFCIFVICANSFRAFERMKRSKMGAGGFIAHLGVGLLMSGLILSRGFERKHEFVIQESDGSKTVEALGYVLSAGKHSTDDVTNRNNKVTINLARPEETLEMRPGVYYTMMGGEMKPMTWPSIKMRPLHDVYLALLHMELDATEPSPIKIGEMKTFEHYEITYQEMTREGEPGKMGTKFGAKLKVADRTTGKSVFVNPRIALAEGGFEQLPAVIGEEYFVTLQGMDAATKTFTMQLHFLKPMYWGELFIKPFTIFVWLGTGILTLGTLMTAFYRRHRPLDIEAQARELNLLHEENKDAASPTPES